jgi:hypothetical protein
MVADQAGPAAWAGVAGRLPAIWEARCLCPPIPAPTPSGEDLPGVERLLALSDGVVAIAITLLVLQLSVPLPAKLHDPASASELATQLGKGADQLVS